MSLTLDNLRIANFIRLPQFKNKHGQLAHSKVDGSDWSPAQWLQALIGELGEFATVREAFERCEITFEEYSVKAAKELADVQTYFSILCTRALDVTEVGSDCSMELLRFMSALGEWANERKKFERRDLTDGEYIALMSTHHEQRLRGKLHDLITAAWSERIDTINIAHPTGVDISKATIEKFNEVSRRVGADVFLDVDGAVTRSAS